MKGQEKKIIRASGNAMFYQMINNYFNRGVWGRDARLKCDPFLRGFCIKCCTHTPRRFLTNWFQKNIPR